MKEAKTIIPLQMLLLNDLFHTGTIDQTIYDMAAQRITGKDTTIIPVDAMLAPAS